MDKETHMSSEPVDIITNIQNKFEEFEQKLNGQSKTAVHIVRREAFKAFSETGFPEKRNEEYKYTNITKAIEQHFAFTSTPVDPVLNEQALANAKIEGLDAYLVVTVNGHLITEASDLQNLPEGIIITDFNDALANYAEDIESVFGNYSNYKNDPYLALNTAFAVYGVFIKVEKNITLQKPIHVINITDTEKGQVIFQPRNLISIANGSTVDIIESNTSIGTNKAFCNEVSEILVGKNSFVNHYKLQIDNSEKYYVGNTLVHQKGDGVFNAFTVTLDGAIIRNNLNIILADQHCEAHMYGLYMIKGKTLVDNHTVADHQQPHSFSNEIYKGIIDDEATGVFNGKIYVRPDAQKTNAFQSNKNILLTDTGRIYTKPQLEIWADDVKCSHGCTTGQLEEEQLFYLRSRGISKDKARVMLLTAFANDVLDQIKIEPLKAYIQHLVDNRFH